MSSNSLTQFFIRKVQENDSICVQVRESILTFLSFTTRRRAGNEILGGVAVAAVVQGVAGRVAVVVGGDGAVLRGGAAGSGVVCQVAHTGALPDRPVSQPDPEELDPPVRAGPRVVSIVAAMRAPTSHDPTQYNLERERERERLG